MGRMFFWLILLRGAFFSEVATAQCLSGDCDNGYGSAIFAKKGGVRYTGTFKNRRPDGRGRAEYPNGRVYVGEWSLGTWHGQGTLTLNDGSQLAGTWQYSRFKGGTTHVEMPIDLEQEINKSQRIADVQPGQRFKQTPPDPTAVADNEPIQRPARRPTVTENPDPSRPSEPDASPIQRPLRQNAVPTKMPKVWGVSVGIASYDNPSVPQLKYPDNDAFKVYAFWQSPQGGALGEQRSRVLVDDAATKRNVKETMKEVYSQAAEDDLILFFFSGHGLKGAFLTTDYDGAALRLNHSEVNEILAACAAKRKIIIADACFSGSYVTTKSIGDRPQTDAELTNAFYRELSNSQEGTAFILSSQANEESLEVSTLHNSVFTYYVLKGLRGEADINSDYVVTVQELFDYVYGNVTSYAQSLGRVQTPVIKGNYDPNMPVAVVPH